MTNNSSFVKRDVKSKCFKRQIQILISQLIKQQQMSKLQVNSIVNNSIRELWALSKFHQLFKVT